MRRQLFPALVAIALFTVLALGYGIVTTLVDEVLFSHQAAGSLVKDSKGRVVGSSLIGQNFKAAQYFHPRPAADDYAAGPDYSYGSNYGPTNPTFLKGVEDAVKAYRKENGLSSDVSVPVDAVTASGSGLDPAITVANAKLQAPRVARERHVPLATVLRLVDEHTEDRTFGVLGEPAVNVLELNLALDRL